MDKISPKKIAIYSRKSKITEKGESIENQIELCRRYIYAHYDGIEPSDIIVYEDEGFSGGHTDRPQFKKMLKDADKQKFSAVVCYRLDRISRNIGDFAKLIEKLNSLNISFISLKEQFDTSSPLGRAMMYIASVFSQLERETIAERIRDNMLELAKTGRWLGGVTPTGYTSEESRKVTVDGKSKKTFHLKLIHHEAKVVSVIFDKFLQTNSLTKTETFLMQNGYTTKNGKLFSRFTIKSILKNPVYMIADKAAYNYFVSHGVELFAKKCDFDGKHGIMAYNKTLQKRGRANQTRDMSEWIVTVGKHKGIISGKDWIKTQEQLLQNKSKAYRKPKSNVALLSGLLFCKNCGSYMRPKLGRTKNEDGERIYSYLCELKEKSLRHNCEIKNPNGNLLDKCVCEQIKRLPVDTYVFTRELESAKTLISGGRQRWDEELERLRKTCDGYGKQIEALVASLSTTAGTAASVYITDKINELHQKRQEIKNILKELETPSKKYALTDTQYYLAYGILSSFQNTFDKMDMEKKREALRTIIDKIVWDGENIHIYLSGTGKKAIPADKNGMPKTALQIIPKCDNSK